MNAPLSPAEERVWRALARAIIVIPRRLDAELMAEQGLTLAQYTVLMHLSEAPERGLRISDLADRGTLSQSAMSRLVDRLSGEGLVERVKCDTDGRQTWVVLTDAGLARLQRAYPTHLRGVREHVISQLDGTDLCVFAEVFRRFADEACPGPVQAVNESTGADRPATSSSSP